MFVQYHEYIGYFWNEKRWTKWLVHVATFLCTVKVRNLRICINFIDHSFIPRQYISGALRGIE